jgi:hypothetical protein
VLVVRWRQAELAEDGADVLFHCGVLTEAQYRSPLGRRPYDLRHAAVSLWLNSGVPATEVARRAGHGVAVLLKIYATASTGRPTPPTSASPTPSAPGTPSQNPAARKTATAKRQLERRRSKAAKAQIGA